VKKNNLLANEPKIRAPAEEFVCGKYISKKISLENRSLLSLLHPSILSSNTPKLNDSSHLRGRKEKLQFVSQFIHFYYSIYYIGIIMYND
jgi:hypothetical protein